MNRTLHKRPSIKHTEISHENSSYSIIREDNTVKVNESKIGNALLNTKKFIELLGFDHTNRAYPMNQPIDFDQNPHIVIPGMIHKEDNNEKEEDVE